MRGEYKIMKKKAIKLATTAAIAASAFTATNVSAASVNVDQLVNNVNDASKQLRWAISIEGSADGKTAPHNALNYAKRTVKAVKAEAEQVKGAQKVKLQAALDEAELQIKRATDYIDAITASEKVKAKTAALNAAVAAKNLDEVEKLHHATTAEVRKQATILYRVYGQSTRAAILEHTKAPAEAAVAATKIDVTVKMYLDAAAAAVSAGQLEKASQALNRADEWLDQTSATFKVYINAKKRCCSSITTISSNRRYIMLMTLLLTVKLSKPASVLLAADDFHFNNGLEVTAHSVSADKKTVTLTTTKQKDGESYSLYFKGKATGLSFTNPKTPDDGTVVADSKEVQRLNAEENRVFTVDLKNTNGSKYTGDVEVKVRSVTGKSQLTSIEGTPIAEKRSSC